MTKAELLERVKGRMATDMGMADISRVTIDKVLTALGREYVSGLANGEEVILPEIGKLQVVKRAARKGRNPRTGEALDIPEKRRVKFKLSVGVKALVNPKS